MFHTTMHPRVGVSHSLALNHFAHSLNKTHTITNKLCKRCQLYGKQHSGTCSANYNKYAPIGNSERTAAKQNMNILLADLIYECDAVIQNTFISRAELPNVYLGTF